MRHPAKYYFTIPHNTPPHKRWFVIGPGIIMAAIIALQVFIHNHQTIPTRPIIEDRVAGTQTPQKVTPAPEVGYLLRHAKLFELSAEQKSALDNLGAEEHAKTEPLNDEMSKSADDFIKFMNSTDGKATTANIQNHSEAVSQLSGQLSSIRRIYWEKALQLLTPEQKIMVEKALAAEPVPIREKPTGETKK